MDLRTYAVLAVGVAAVAEDLRSRTISNWTTVGAALCGLAIHCWANGWSGLWHAGAGLAIGAGVFLVFYLLGGMGGGDIKLMAGFGALLGSGLIWTAAFLAALAGGVFALLYLAWQRVRRRWRTGRGEQPPGQDEEKFMPYAPAITAGAWLAMVNEL